MNASPRRLGALPVSPEPTNLETGSAVSGEFVGPSWDATGVAIVGILITALALPGSGPASYAAHTAAIGVGCSLIASTLLELHGGLRNLMRTDLLGLAAFYFLSLFEFLLPRPTFDLGMELPSAVVGLRVVFCGMIGLLLGRHLWRPKRQPFGDLLTRPTEPYKLVYLFWVCASLGYLHMLLAVNFNVFEMVHFFMEPRFTQPWGRGRLGDWKALVGELALLIQLLPPIFGIMLARRERFTSWAFWTAGAICLFTFFYGFTSGTRNVFGTYLVTFLIGYALSLRRSQRKQLIIALVACAAAMVIATRVMLDFRNVGFSSWIQGTSPKDSEDAGPTFFVDDNLLAISRLTEVFPKEHDYLGFEVLWMGLVRPIPRAVWPGKPIDLSVTIEEVLGQTGVTITATYAGEAYMSGGFLGVILASLGLGALMGWWNYLNEPRNSELGILIYASGFFAAVITMRSTLVFTTSLLPTFAGLLCVRLLTPAVMAGARRLGGMARPRVLPHFQPNRKSSLR